MRHLLAALLILLPASAFAQGAPRSIADCERIKVDMAYNQCLAEFGPKRGERPPRGAQVSESGEEAAPAAVRSSRRGRASYQRGRRGRKAASFTVGGRKSYTGYTRKKRRR
ncbi:hypothetical protein [Salinarimonas soli]|uniref:Uncharacterized protein n=1 Tax=Salinarimonas soli TaxID=1638099 RepID=A0A5B2VBT9_9HYPH|nr:hypothetical protein [Salinarimonas soli]KAA2235607.1 hypothetical protein F0L46_19095 [Salinarimonas soli]